MKRQIYLRLGLQAHASGHLDVARKNYLEALNYEPNCAEALGWLGSIEAQKGNHSYALSLLERAVAIDKENFDFRLNLANTLQLIGKFGDAISNYAHLLELKRNHVVHSNIAACYNHLKDFSKGFFHSQQALQISGDFAPAWSNKGVALKGLGYFNEALIAFEKALTLNASDVLTWSNHGAVLNDLKRYGEALDSYERALQLDPSNAEAWGNRGITLVNLKRDDEALASYHKAISLNPSYPETWSNLGVLLDKLKRYGEALDSYERALQLDPSNAEAWSNRGVTLVNLKRDDEALASYQRAIDSDQFYVEARYNKALLQLWRFEFVQGFQSFRYRWQTRNFPSQPIRTELPLFERNCKHSKIFLWAEQGLGDEIFYSGLLIEAQKIFAKIFLYVDKRLCATLQRSFPAIQVIGREMSNLGMASSGADCQMPMGNLGQVLGYDRDAFEQSLKPFLTSNPDLKRRYRRQLEAVNQKILCGLSWKSANPVFGREKSIDLSQFGSVLSNSRFEFICLQYGATKKEVEEFEERFGLKITVVEGLDLHDDIEGLTALVDACDLIITTSSVTAHLAGALGKTGVVLVPFSVGKLWYWHSNNGKSFWYPNLDVFYQETPDDWSLTMAKVADWLEKYQRESQSKVRNV